MSYAPTVTQTLQDRIAVDMIQSVQTVAGSFRLRPCLDLNLGTGFLIAFFHAFRYTTGRSLRFGPLRATRRFRSLSAWLHRSGEKAAKAVSCVGRQAEGCRDVALSPRRVSGGSPTDRQRLTSANALRSKDKTTLCRPATSWAMRRKAYSAVILRPSQTKDLRFGPTKPPLRGRLTQERHQQASEPDGQRSRWPDMGWVCAVSNSGAFCDAFFIGDSP